MSSDEGAPDYPGVYVEELPSGVRTITGVATSIAAFVGYAERGPANQPTLVQSFSEFTRVFGGLCPKSTMSYAVRQFFLNGGRDALIVRVVPSDAARGMVTIGDGDNAITLEAANEGAWSENLRIRVDYDTRDTTSTTLFNLSVQDESTGLVETFRDLFPSDPLASLVEQRSTLVRVTDVASNRPPDGLTDMPRGADGSQAEADLVPDSDDGKGVYALARADLFNLLCIPPFLPASSSSDGGRVLSPKAKGSAAAFCAEHRALFLVDRTRTGSAPPTSRLREHSTHTTASRPTTARMPLSTSPTSARLTPSRMAPWSTSHPAGRLPASWRTRMRPAESGSRPQGSTPDSPA